MKGNWRQIFAQVQRELPRDATPQERGRATRRAAAMYRGRHVQSNPGGPSLITLGLIGVGAYLLMKSGALGKQG